MFLTFRSYPDLLLQLTPSLHPRAQLEVPPTIHGIADDGFTSFVPRATEITNNLAGTGTSKCSPSILPSILLSMSTVIVFWSSRNRTFTVLLSGIGFVANLARNLPWRTNIQSWEEFGATQIRGSWLPCTPPTEK